MMKFSVCPTKKIESNIQTLLLLVKRSIKIFQNKINLAMSVFFAYNETYWRTSAFATNARINFSRKIWQIWRWNIAFDNSLSRWIHRVASSCKLPCATSPLTSSTYVPHQQVNRWPMPLLFWDKKIFEYVRGKYVRHRAALSGRLAVWFDDRYGIHLSIGYCPMNGARHCYTSCRGAHSNH